MADPAPLLEIDRLSVSFNTPIGEARAVNEVSFRLDRGEVLGIVGESGSGKSMTAMSIIGLLPGGARRSGSIRVDGVDVMTMPTSSTRDLRGGTVGTIFQDPLSSLNPVMKIGAQLVETMKAHGRPGTKDDHLEHAADLLRRVGITNPVARLSTYPHELSGGMRQRVMIAMAIANSPALLIADEPTTALDVTTQVQVLRTLNEVRSGVDAAMILITHDLGVIGDVADRIAVMYNGRLVEVGPTAQVLEDPQHPYTAGLLLSRPRLDTARGALHAIPGTPPRITADFAGCSFAPRCNRVSADAACERQRPDLVPVARNDHRAACFLAGSARPSVEVAPTARSVPAPASGKSPFEVAQLVKEFPLGRGRRAPVLTAVDHVSFDLRAGKTLALVGESGCGKSTVARSVLRLIEPTSGSVRLGEVDVMGLSKKGLRDFRTRIQMVFQDSTAALNPRQTVGELIAEPMMQQGLLDRAGKRARIDELLTLVAMYPEHADRYPSELSGGQRQRIAIARALGLEPDVLVLDEPVSALDVSIQAQVLKLLVELQDRLGIAYLFISHDLGVVRQLADDIAVMYLGRVVESGPADQVLADPQHPYTQLLVASVPGEGSINQAEFELAGVVTNLPNGCRFADRCPLAEPACSASVPPLVTLSGAADGGSRSVACHRHDVARHRFREVAR